MSFPHTGVGRTSPGSGVAIASAVQSLGNERNVTCDEHSQPLMSAFVSGLGPLWKAGFVAIWTTGDEHSGPSGSSCHSPTAPGDLSMLKTPTSPAPGSPQLVSK